MESEEAEVKAPIVVQAPQVVTQTKVEAPIKAKKDQVLHALLDAKIEKIDEVKDRAANMDLDKWSKIVARLHTDRDVKVDTTITAMGIFALFPVAMQEEG